MTYTEFCEHCHYHIGQMSISNPTGHLVVNSTYVMVECAADLSNCEVRAKAIGRFWQAVMKEPNNQSTIFIIGL